MSAPGPPPKIPSLARRLIVATLMLIPLLIFWVGLPTAALSELGSHGVDSSLGIQTVSIAGVVLSFLAASRYAVRPTRGYGPVAFLAGVVTSAYLLAIVPFANLSLTIGGSVDLTLNYGPALLLLAIVPVFGAAAGLVTTIEDGLRPGERLPFDYPP